MSKNLANKVLSCTTDDVIELGSGAPLRGHVPVITEFKAHNPQNNSTSVKEKLNIDSIKWAQWTDELEKSIQNDEEHINAYEDPEQLWKFIEKMINEVTSKNSKMKKSTTHSKPFWTKNLTRLCEEMRRTRKVFQKRNSDMNRLNMILAKEKI